MISVQRGAGTSRCGPGVLVTLDSDAVATAIDAYLVAHNVYVSGPRTTHIVNGRATVYVDPSGFVIADGVKTDGAG